MVSPFGSPRRSALAETRYWTRLVWLPLLCFAFMGLALVRSSKANQPVEPRPRVETAAPTTPLLSVRRLPNAVALPAQVASLRGPALAGLAALPPETTCASVMNSRGVPVFQHNASLLLSPASNEKVLLAYGALTQLGQAHTFGTTVATDAQIVGGVVQGNVWLVGGGDPVLATQDYVGAFVDQQRVFSPFESLADQLRAAGITRIKGNVLGDASRYDDVLYHPNWPSRFGANGVVGPISALALNNGFADFSKGGQEMAGSGAPSSNPPRSAASSLIDLLKERGITVDGRANAGAPPPGPTVLAELQSPPLKAIVGQMLRTSDNSTAEMLFKELGVARAGGGSFASGSAALTAILAEHGFSQPGMVLSDGSGLDTADRVSCTILNAVLDAAGRSSDLAGGLAVAGRSGTLRNRFAETAAVGQVSAKTGTLDTVSSLSGFVDTTTGETATFALIINERGAEQYKPIEEQFVQTLLSYPGGPDIAALLPLP